MEAVSAGGDVSMIGRESITVKEMVFLCNSSGCCLIEDVSNEQSGCSEIMFHVSQLRLFGFCDFRALFGR